MKTDEFAFFNRQLAAMVRDGIPLESALRRLCADMRRSTLRTELEKIESDLAKGIPLRDAVRDRQLPELYRQMLEIASASNDLPGILTMLADHYERQHTVATRLKGLMVYPAIVLIASFLLSCFLAIILTALAREMLTIFMVNQSPYYAGLWIPPILIGILALGLLIINSVPRFRRSLRWRVPGFKEVALARAASTLHLALSNGASFEQGINLVQIMERGTPAENELIQWRANLAAGKARFSDVASASKVFPKLFVWIVSQSKEDLSGGFRQVSHFYQTRAAHRIETLLYAALPCAVLALGMVIICQIHPALAAVVSFFRMMEVF